jgi:hypothetical protein
MTTSPAPSSSANAAAIEDGIRIRLLGVELKSSGSPLRQAVGLVLRHHPDVILDLIRQDLGTVGALTPERVAEIIADLAACTGPAQRA